MSERIPPPPPTQALNTTTFVPPPLDLSLTAAEIIDFHRVRSPNHVAYIYENAPGECKQITFSPWIRAIHRAGHYVRNLFQIPEPQAGGAKPIISLLPLQTSAQALVQVLSAKATPPALHLHLVNPTPSQWDDVFDHIAKKLDVPLVPYPEWLSKLRGASTTVQNAQAHSALRLLEFYGSLNQGSGPEAGGLPSCNTEVARGVCPVLNEEGLRDAEAEEIQRWLDYWKSLGLLKF